MSTPADLLGIAATQIGTHEDPAGSNRTPYGRWYGLNGVSWCSIFVAWCLDQVGIDARRLVSPDFAGCTPALAGWRRIGRDVPVSQLQPGDVVYYHFAGEHAGANHTGIVESVGPRSIIAIEGNTSGGGSQAHGGIVMRRERAKSLIVGAGRPPWTTTAPPAPVPLPQPSTPTEQDEDMTRIYQHPNGAQMRVSSTSFYEYGAGTTAANADVDRMHEGQGPAIVVDDATWMKLKASRRNERA